MSSKFTDFNLDTNAYAAFDATSLRDLIIDRLNQENIFTDQVFQGSNMSSIIDIVAYSYHVLLFYLNKTSSEAMFTDSVIYENMNRIVKTLNYKPVGYRSSTCTFECTTTLDTGSYTIPRYSFVSADGVIYSTRDDIPFDASATSEIATSNSKYILYQGKYQEYPVQVASGENYEVITLALDRSVLVDHHSIDVYVQSADTGLYTQWTETDSLFLNDKDSEVYECRLNENYRYEIKFGNDVNGKKLVAGDQVCIYYVKSDGSSGIIGPNKLKDLNLTLFSTNQFSQIKQDVKQEKTNYVTLDQTTQIFLDNQTTSTDPQQYESVEEMRQSAPGFLAHQNRLVTSNDFENYIKSTFGNIVTDVKAMNNKEYIDSHVRYLADELNLQKPVLESRLLVNHIDFASSSTFNNVYLYVVPRLEVRKSLVKQSNFLSVAQKENIRNGLQGVKSLGLEPVFVDPVYVAVDICAGSSSTTPSVDLVGGSKLHVVRNPNVPRDVIQLKSEVVEKINTYFKHSQLNLGQIVSLSELHSSILSIPGVESVYTQSDTTKTNGMSVAVWNPVYPHDFNIYNQNFTLPQFKFPYLYDIDQLAARVVIET